MRSADAELIVKLPASSGKERRSMKISQLQWSTGCAMVGLWHACIGIRLMMASIGFINRMMMAHPLITSQTHPSSSSSSSSLSSSGDGASFAWTAMNMINTHLTMFLAITALLAALVFVVEPIGWKKKMKKKKINNGPAVSSPTPSLIASEDDVQRKNAMITEDDDDELMRENQTVGMSSNPSPSPVLCGILSSWYVCVGGCLWVAAQPHVSWGGVNFVVTIFLVTTTISAAVACCGVALIGAPKKIHYSPASYAGGQCSFSVGDFNLLCRSGSLVLSIV
ncbi:uncharacterized protein LOC131157791 isoform X2 [Malania oleifera]|uniref:uncharacterized protein LOC131157791 isoform X2 n=1 Tax=Malania oleifera TaxID=397392 RepID=UPI0025ADDE7D|nr:uncharacterized protein LOC131157791 isoform X2 [Malania oleifera]